ncbi:MAG: ABC transporter permease [Tissierellia bacterium]|nr:ABC transporter permease [Tissierellia bacterium]
MTLFGKKKTNQVMNHMEENIKEEDLFTFATFEESKGEEMVFSDYSYWGSTARVFLKNRFAMILLSLLILMVLFTLIQPYLPNQYNPNTIVNDPGTGMQLRNIPPGDEFILGTNSIGQDLWARIWSGTRTSLFIGIMVASIQALIGITVGVLWGYIRKLDFVLTELYNILDNIPNTIVLILISYIMRPSIRSMIFAMCLTGWIGMARFIRNQIIIIRDRDYNVASRTLGTPVHRIVFKNLLPYLVSVIMLQMALTIPMAIGNEVFIAYIGLGLPVNIPSLGNLINEGRVLATSPALRYQLLYPTIFLSFITISFYIIGNAFSDAADPKNHM